MSEAVPAASPRNSRWDLAVRLFLVIVALTNVWLAERRFIAWGNEYQTTFEWEVLPQLEWMALAAAAGLAFGFAAWLPRRGRYRWGLSAILAVAPLALIAHYFFIWGGGELPFGLSRVTSFDFPRPQFALSAFVGFAIAAGFSAPSRSR